MESDSRFAHVYSVFGAVKCNLVVCSDPYAVAHSPDWALCWEVGAVGQAGDPSVPHPGSMVPEACCLSKDKLISWRICWVRPLSGLKHNSSYL